jgi:hypothetical protein
MFQNQLPVKIKSGAGLPPDFTEGVVVGIMTIEMPVLGRFYAVDVGRPVSDVYPYQVVGVPEIQLEEPCQPDPVCFCCKTSEGQCPRCGQNMK